MNTLEQMKEKFDTLPTDFQEAIRTYPYDQKLQAVAKKFKLHIDQLVELEKAMSDIVFGDLRASNLAHNLGTNLRISQEQANEIALDLNSNILVPLKDLIKHIQNKNEELVAPKNTDDTPKLREVL